MDLKVLSALVAGLNIGTVARVVKIYLRDLDARGEVIANAIAANEPDVARREAHALKSPSRLLGAVELGNFCHRIETDEIDQSSMTADGLRHRLEATQDGLRRWLDGVGEGAA